MIFLCRTQHARMTHPRCHLRESFSSSLLAPFYNWHWFAPPKVWSRLESGISRSRWKSRCFLYEIIAYVSQRRLSVMLQLEDIKNIYISLCLPVCALISLCGCQYQVFFFYHLFQGVTTFPVQELDLCPSPNSNILTAHVTGCWPYKVLCLCLPEQTQPMFSQWLWTLTLGLFLSPAPPPPHQP